MTEKFSGFPKTLIGFLEDLERNNNREWLQAHKEDHVERVQEPALAFVCAIAPRLTKISPHILADDRKVGGSMMRLNRDVRFRDAGKFRDAWGDLAGDSLKRPPRGYPPDHPLVEDLKRKAFVGFCVWESSALTTKDFLTRVLDTYKTSTPFMRFLCEALSLPF